MFLDVEWAGIQRESVSKYGYAIFWKTPLQQFAQRECYELNEKDGDNDKGDYQKIEYRQVGIDVGVTYVAAE
jgi:hypothetical protein